MRSVAAFLTALLLLFSLSAVAEKPEGDFEGEADRLTGPESIAEITGESCPDQQQESMAISPTEPEETDSDLFASQEENQETSTDQVLTAQTDETFVMDENDSEEEKESEQFIRTVTLNAEEYKNQEEENGEPEASLENKADNNAELESVEEITEDSCMDQPQEAVLQLVPESERIDTDSPEIQVENKETVNDQIIVEQAYEAVEAKDEQSKEETEESQAGIEINADYKTEPEPAKEITEDSCMDQPQEPVLQQMPELETIETDFSEPHNAVEEKDETAEMGAENVTETKEDAPSDVLSTTAYEVLPMSDYAAEDNVYGFVYRIYKTVMQREPDEEGLRFWVDKLEKREYTAADVIVSFFISDEYAQSGKGNDEIIQDCYQTMLNRNPDEQGFDFWRNRLDVGMTPLSILAGFVYSDEFTGLISRYGVERGDIAVTNPRDKNYERTYFVYRLYNNCLGRAPETAGQEYWCAALENGTSGAQIAGGFFFSDEFNKNRYNNSAFVQLLYSTIQGRTYDSAGLVYWTTKLNYTDSREKVLNGFIGSEEFRGQCLTADIQPGEPIDTPDDSVEWQYNTSVLRLCNNERRAAGLPDLYTREDLLWDLAMKRTAETTVQFSHTRPNGTSCFTLFTEQGFYGYLGENLAAGSAYSDPEKVVLAWMNSEGHRANIMNPKYTYVATGYIYDPDAETYCAEGKYKGNYVKFESYSAQSFCNYGSKIK